MRYDYVVLGAGVAGLAFAHEVAAAGHSVLLLEKEPAVGGLSRTLEFQGFRFDYCAHRFHSGNPALIERVKTLVGPSFQKHTKRSRMYMFHRYLRYPFELPSLLAVMPPHESLHAAVSFTWNWVTRRRRRARIVSYKDWFIYHFGPKLYSILCAPYTSKIWGTDPANLSADWADQRFQGVKLDRVMKQMITRLLAWNRRPSYGLDDEQFDPDGGEFYYGATGAQEIPDAFARALRQYRADIKVGANVTNVWEGTRQVEYVHEGQPHRAMATEALITTIPLHVYYRLLDQDEPAIEQALARLTYMDIIFVYLLVNRERISRDHWLYFQDRDILFNRLVEFKNWSEQMAPPGKTGLCFDVTCFEGDEIWGMSDEALVEACLAAAEKAKLLARVDVFDAKVVRVRHAYPFYDLGYREKVQRIVQFFERSGKIFCLGRTGIFQYNNTDHSIEMGWELAQRLLRRDRRSLIDDTIQRVSH